MAENKLKIAPFIIKMLLFTVALYYIHYSINTHFFKTHTLQISLYKIYGFLFITVTAFAYILAEQGNKDVSKILQTFLWLSMLKMVLVLVFLLPIFLNKTDELKATVFSFFIPYFVYLVFEIWYSLKLLGLKK